MSMSFNSPLRCADMERDLFVELATDHQQKHFVLASSQGANPSLKGIQPIPLVAAVPISCEPTLNCLEQCGFRDRFGQKIFGASLHGLHAGRHTPLPGEKHNRQYGGNLVQPDL